MIHAPESTSALVEGTVTSLQKMNRRHDLKSRSASLKELEEGFLGHSEGENTILTRTKYVLEGRRSPSRLLRPLYWWKGDDLGRF